MLTGLNDEVFIKVQTFPSVYFEAPTGLIERDTIKRKNLFYATDYQSYSLLAP